MQILDLEQRTPEWKEARRRKITGTRLGELVVKRGTGKKIGYYDLLGEFIAEAPSEENPMDRGTRLEDTVVAKMERITGLTFGTPGLCISDVSEHIALSPDGLTSDEKTAIEIKCLSTGKHLQALIEQKIPSDYELQALQYFIAIEKLEKLYFTFYDDRVPSKNLHYIVLTREEKQEEIEKFTQYQLELIEEIKQLAIKIEFDEEI